jgi:CBS domain-containing protein
MGNKTMLVENVMTHSIRTVSPQSRIMEVASIMCLYRISGLPVVEEGNKLVGIIAEKDVLHRMFPTLQDLMEGNMGSIDLDEMMGKYKDVMNLTVTDLMSANPITVSPKMHILRASAIMVRNKFRRIPVAENGELCGMLSLGDVHKAIFHSNVAEIGRTV